MARMLEKLDSPEAFLLMYLAEELSAADRAEVERRLGADPALRRRLAELTDLHQMVDLSLAQADGESEDAAVSAARARRVAREMRRHQVEITARPAVERPTSNRWAWWAYPASAAAAAVFVLIGLWGAGVFDSDPPDKPPVVIQDIQYDKFSPETLLAEFGRSMGQGARSDAEHVLPAGPDDDELTLALYGRM